MTTPALSLDQIAERLQGYDPQALSASQVNAFLAQLVQPVREQETVPLMQAHSRTSHALQGRGHRLRWRGLARFGASR
jgi:hypothetical protein